MSNGEIEAFWENATAEDVAKIANTRKPISARVRDEETEVWREDLISGWRLSRFLPGAIWIDADGVHWKQCQVYREPSWYTDKPDPGPGWRLLGKFPDEPKLGTDEALQYDKTTWNRVRTDSGIQDLGVWYRRRIEAVGPVDSKPLLIRRRVVEIGDEIKLPNGRVLVFNGEGFEVTQ
jgi:hypothetical protein